MPIKKTPDITDIIGESRMQKTESQNDEVMRRCDDEVINKEEECSKKKEISPSNFEEVPEGRGSLYENQNSNFNDSWRTMFGNVFSSVPTIYIPLKESLPEIENNIIKVTVKNDIQKEHFEAKTREVLEFLRTHFDEKIEDVIVVTNEQLETKKIIYDVKEKLQNFKEQNPEIEDFIQILDLKIKD